jgi:hypothetical protein
LSGGVDAPPGNNDPSTGARAFAKSRLSHEPARKVAATPVSCVT